MSPPFPSAISRRAALRRIVMSGGAAATLSGCLAHRPNGNARSPLDQFRLSPTDSRLLEELERSATAFFARRLIRKPAL